jgi:hypothetical protein
MSDAPTTAELSPADVASLERSALSIVEIARIDQRGAILDAMDRAYLELALRYESRDEESSRAWAHTMGRRLRALVADIGRRRNGPDPADRPKAGTAPQATTRSR